MSNYTKTTNFASKDNLSPGNPLKIVKGTEIDTEFNNIATAVATKTDNASANITGGSITGITDLAIADGGTGASTANAALNNLLPSQASASGKYLKSNGTDASWDQLDISTADITGTLPVANGGTGVTSSTGTGSVVLSDSPTLVTPALGTPSSGTATNLTGLPISTGVSGLGTGVATFLGTPSSANLASAVTDETGSGALVFANSPTLVTPALGTPSSATLTNATGLPISTGVSGLGTGVASFLATPSSANLATAVSDETGSGALVFANSPTLVTPALGTPSSATLTNATGLPIATGVSGLGTGVATALAVNVGSAGAPVVNGGVLGTPSSGTATNLTGLPISTGVSGLGTGVATALAVNVGSAGAPVVNGGALGTPSSGTATNLTGLPLSTGVTGTLPVANGGTGQTSYTDGQLLIGNSTGNTLSKATLTAGSNITITNGNGSITIAATGGGGGSGDVVGPSSATANGVALFDGTTGKLLKDSASTDGLIYGLTVGRGAGAVSTNTAVGASALVANTTGLANTGLGNSALKSNTTASYSVAVGHRSLEASTGAENTSVGAFGLYLNTTGTMNAGFGGEALAANTTGSYNTAIGTQSLNSNTTANENTAVGYQSLSSNTGSYNTAVGYQSLKSNTTGASNNAFGDIALFANTTGSNNTAMGVNALTNNTTADSNSAFGVNALRSNSTGASNTAVGLDALRSNTTASNNTALGYQAGYTGTTAYDNVFVGKGAGYGITTGYENVFIGTNAGQATTATTTGAQNIYIGPSARGSAAGNSGEIVIGAVKGGKGTNTAYISGGDGPTYNGANTTTWATTSDARIKKNVVEVTGGLAIINALRPVEFDYKENDKHEVGFIAQEFATVLPDQVKSHDANDAEKEWVDSDGKVFYIQQNLVPYLVKAIQELKAEFDAYKATHP